MHWFSLRSLRSTLRSLRLDGDLAVSEVKVLTTKDAKGTTKDAKSVGWAKCAEEAGLVAPAFINLAGDFDPAQSADILRYSAVERLCDALTIIGSLQPAFVARIADE
jgi:hypothetical protein